MRPLSYVKRKLLQGQEQRKRKYYLANIFGIISLLIIVFFLAPLVHDLFHVLILKLFNCYYTFYFNFGWEVEFQSNIQTFCNLSDEKAVIMLGSGILGTFFISVVFFFLSWFLGKEGKLSLSNFLFYPALGFLTDPIFYFLMRKGDLVNILEIINQRELLSQLPYFGLFLFLIALLYTYFHMINIFRDYSQIKKSIEEVDDFFGKN